MKWIVPIILFCFALFVHLYQVPNTPIEEEIISIFGGTLSNEAVATTTVETTNLNTNITSPGIVWTSDTTGYIFYEAAIGGLWVSSTTDSGATWTAGRNVDSVNPLDVVSYGVWWEGWTPGTTTTRYIHIGSTDLGVDDTYYTRLDTQTGALTTTVLGTTQAASCGEGSSCQMSITMTATGTLYMAAADGTDSWVVRCGQYQGCSTASNWHEITGAYTTNQDWVSTLLPVPGTDNIMLMYQLPIAIGNANISKIFSATSSTWWANVTYTTNDTNTTYDGQMWGATLSTSTGLLYAVAVDDANEYVTTQDHDVLMYSYSTTTWSWTQKTDCVTNAAGGIIGAKIAWDETNDTLYCVFGRRTTIGTNTTGGIYYKTSTNGGTTWSATSTMVNDNADDINGMTVNIIGDHRIGVTWNYSTAPRQDDQYYDDIADLMPDGGGGGTPNIIRANIIWYD